MLKKRVEVLFDPSEFRRLEGLAHSSGRSVGSVVREAVEKYVLQPTHDEKRKAVEWILSGEDDLGSWDELKEAMSRGPAEEIVEIDRQIAADRR